jgi:NAD(P)-dependent dehydrogenase (short-subunit alcohol dehydrogenase family)
MTITFITGANKGLGRGIARRLIERGHTVLVGARDHGLGAAAADALGARFVPIDVTDDDSVAAAAADVEKHEGSVDVLINNAGLHGPAGDPSELTGDDVLGVFDVNVAGVMRIAWS